MEGGVCFMYNVTPAWSERAPLDISGTGSTGVELKSLKR